MQVIYEERGEGKTTKAIKESHLSGFTIVCIHASEVRRVMKEANRLGFRIPEPITWDELQHAQGRGITGLIVDNADMILQRHAPYPVEIITVSK